MIEKSRSHTILTLWQTLHNNWALKNSFEYFVQPSENIRGKSLDEMKRVPIDHRNTAAVGSLKRIVARS
jgi:hypothetical protein